MQENPDHVDADGLAKILNISTDTLYRYLRDGYPTIRNHGRGVDPNQIPDVWITAQKRRWLKSVAIKLKKANDRGEI